MRALRKIWESKVVTLIKKFLQQGISPERLALSVSLGITLGIIPLIGVTTVMIAGIVFLLRLNFAATQLVHYIVHPIQIALFVPFIKLGEIFHNGDVLPGSFFGLLHQAKTDLWGTLQDFWIANLSAIGIWVIIAIPLGIIVYRISLVTFKKYALIYIK
ncbi:MAG: DUF2062 domain-containing protein [Bacteroidales bacterium]|nr:DUF2062 domain-containing protein [Bacteroidales bacterium]